MIEPICIELPTVFGMKTVNCYLFKEPEPILIDCGENSEANWQALKKGVENEGLQLSDIKKVYISHLHIDHFGTAGRLAENFGTEIWLNEFSDGPAQHFDNYDAQLKKLIYHYAAKLVSYNPQELENPFIKLATKNKKQPKGIDMWHPIPEALCKVYKDGDLLNFGNQKWKVMYMPGHCQNQVVYYQAQSKQLLSTDMILKVTPSPFFESESLQPDVRIKGLPIMMESYNKLLKLDIDVAYPGHYEIIQNPKLLVEKQVKHIHARKEKCYSFIANGTDNFLQLYQQMYEHFTIPAFTMLTGYIDLLEAEGKVKWIEDETSIGFECVWRYI